MTTYVSTRGEAPEATFAEAILRGIAPDGGLYLPKAWPQASQAEIAAMAELPYADVARPTLGAFAGASLPGRAIDEAARKVETSFAHPQVTPLVELEPGLFMLELFWGPTAAFKDLAMQMMAPMLDAALAERDQRLLLLTATSGDTGAAAVRAFAGAERIRLAVLHPLGRVSPVQRRQMTTVDAPNVLNLAVRGDFDDCQRLVKLILADEALRARTQVSSVNSINWGRLAGQIPYYLAAGSRLGAPARWVVPTGNFGDAFAGWAATRMGLQAGRFTAAVNANDALAQALATGRYTRAATKPTASVSMDVQAPSNFERLVFECSGRDAERTRAFFETFSREGAVAIEPDLLTALRAEVAAVSIDDGRTAEEIRRAWKAYGRVICPHTAVALAAARGLERGEGPLVVLATAHPAKFPEFVGAALGFEPEPPPQILAIGDRPERFETLAPDPALALAAVEGLLAR
jgi:threonine synthase